MPLLVRLIDLYSLVGSPGLRPGGSLTAALEPTLRPDVAAHAQAIATGGRRVHAAAQRLIDGDHETKAE